MNVKGEVVGAIGENTDLIKNWQLQNSMTPYILEESELRATQIDIFSRLMKERIIWINGPVNDTMASIVQAQLMYLDSTDTRDIIMYIDTPGGSVKAGLGIVDVMDYVSCDIQTLNVGMCASMGSILLGAGTKGKRASLKHSKVMIHQVSGGYQGVVQDMGINWDETQKYNKELMSLLAGYTGKTTKQILKDADRDFWLTSDEALKYGIIDEVVTKKRRK